MRYRLIAIALIAFLRTAMVASDELQTTTKPLVFLSAETNKKLVIFAKRKVKVDRPQILWLSDQSTGRPVDFSSITIKNLDQDIVQAGGFIRLGFEITSAADRNKTLDGEFAIPYELQDQNSQGKEMFVKSFTLLGSGVSGVSTAGNATLDFITGSGTPPVSRFLIAASRDFDACLIARIAPVLVIEARVTDVFNSTESIPLEPNPVSIIKPVSRVAVEQPVCMQLRQGGIAPSAMKVTGALVVSYRVPSASAEVKKAIWNFELVRPAASVSIGLNNTFVVPVVRTVPWRDQAVSQCVPYFTTPAQAKLSPQTPFQSEVYIDKSRLEYAKRAQISAAANANRELCIHAVIPNEVTNAKGRIRIAPPDVMQATDIVPIFQVKDYWLWRLMTAVAAYTFALIIYLLTTRLRSRLEHRASRASISLRLARFLAANPELTDHDSIVFIRQLLIDSEQEDRRENFDLAGQIIASADSRMSQLETAPPTVATDLNAASAGEIRVRNAPDQMISGRTITFQIGHRLQAWTPGSIFKWEVGRSDETMIEAGSGTEKTSLSRFFPSEKAPVNWIVRVSANNVSTSRPITLAPDDRSLTRRLKSLNLLPHFLAMTFAVLAAYVATNSAETWGTSTDYLNLFLASLGLSGGVQSFAVVLQTLRH